MARTASSKAELIRRQHRRLLREYDAKVKEATSVLASILGEALNYVTLYPTDPSRPATHYEVHLNRDCEVTFAMLQAISEAFKTKLINLRHEAGWEGTEETAGDPDKLCLTIAVVS
jgi:hypothetical protein